jgi:hypothetical protein
MQTWQSQDLHDGQGYPLHPGFPRKRFNAVISAAGGDVTPTHPFFFFVNLARLFTYANLAKPGFA